MFNDDTFLQLFFKPYTKEVLVERFHVNKFEFLFFNFEILTEGDNYADFPFQAKQTH